MTFHTKEGCNATLLCNQKGNVTWLDSDTSQKIEGEINRDREIIYFKMN